MSNLIQSPVANEKPKIYFDNTVGGFNSGQAYRYDMNYHKMSDFLGLSKDQRMDYKTANKLSYLRDFTKAKDELSAQIALRKIIKELGVQSQGQELVDTLYKYTRLYSDRQNVSKELETALPSEKKKLLEEQQNVNKTFRAYDFKVPTEHKPKSKPRVDYKKEMEGLKEELEGLKTKIENNKIEKEAPKVEVKQPEIPKEPQPVITYPQQNYGSQTYW